MGVFIAWSGSRSKAIAEILRRWLQNVLPHSKPYLSTIDVPSGNDWLTDVAEHLDSANIGIMCLTSENLKSPWMMFEAGAVAKAVKNHRLVPFLFGDLQSEHLPDPLKRYKASRVDKEGLKEVIASLGEFTMDAGQLDTQALIDSTWPDFQRELQTIPRVAITSPIEGIWGDRFGREYGGGFHHSVLRIANTPNGWSIIGEEFDNDGESVLRWESIAVGLKENQLHYVFEAQLRGSSPLVKGITALAFDALRNDHETSIYCRYSGYFVNLFRAGNRLIQPKDGMLDGWRINDEEAQVLFANGDLKTLAQKCMENKVRG